MIIRALVAVTCIALMSACVYPSTVVEQGASPSAIYFSGAPEGARVLIDNADAGPASSFDGRRQVLAVAPGRHNVRVVLGETNLYNNDVYVGAGSRIEVRLP